MDQKDLVFSKDRYNRAWSDESQALALALQHGYKKEAFVVPSGLCAISTILNAAIRVINPDLILYANEIYNEAPRLIELIANVHNVAAVKFNIQTCHFKSYIGTAKRIIVYAESYSNPHGYEFKYSALNTIKTNNTMVHLIIDNTWMTEIIHNPFEHGADSVVSSLTKHVSNGKAIGGAIMVNEAKISHEVTKWISINGLHISPHNAEIILSQYPTMQERIKKASIITLNVIEFLMNKRVKVTHPFIDGKNMIYYPSVFTITVDEPKSVVLEAIRASKLIINKTSFGSAETRSDPWPQQRGSTTYFRIAIGHASTYEDNIKGIAEILSKFNI